MMKTDSGKTASVWMATDSTPSFPSVDKDITCDVCIVGAGIAGLSVAYHLAKAGRQVVIMDDGPIAGGETCRTTAHLVSAIDDRFSEIERLHGANGLRLAFESHQRAIERIQNIVEEEQINCDFSRLNGYLFLNESDKLETLETELACAQRAGFADVEMVDRAPITNFDTGACLRFPRQGQFHVLKYLDGLIRVIQTAGGRIFANTHAESMTGGKPAVVTTGNRRRITAEAIVVATNSPVNDWVTIHTKQMPYRTFAIAARVPSGSVEKALYWDTASPYHYVRLQRSEDAEYDYLIIGGEDHKTGQADDAAERFDRLEKWGRERWPKMQDIHMRWSGQVMETIDGLGFIGRNPGDEGNVFIATGDSGMGMTHGTIAGMLISDLILGRENPWVELYDPARIRIGALGEFLQENINTAAQYREYLTRGEVESEEQIHRDAGAILRDGLSKIAVYRDGQGELHRCKAVCPHLGAIVQWNSTEESWDCPAHGSRFAAEDGHAINGPANTGLQNVESSPEEDEKAA